MAAAMSMQMAQPVPLLPGSKKTGHVHVNMYVDDRGISKGLPTNTRASMLSPAGRLRNKCSATPSSRAYSTTTTVSKG